MGNSVNTLLLLPVASAIVVIGYIVLAQIVVVAVVAIRTCFVICVVAVAAVAEALPEPAGRFGLCGYKRRQNCFESAAKARARKRDRSQAYPVTRAISKVA